MNGKKPTKAAEQNGPWRQYLIINNVSKWKNIRNMLVSASAFGVEEVFIVGLKKFPLEKEQQTKEQQDFFETLQFKTRRFDKLKECQIYCHERNIRIMGVEIMENAKSIVEQPFQGHTAFLMGNEGSGMNSSQIEICDDFVIIPQYGGGTASLNVTVAASIVMHTFALWAKTPIYCGDT